MLADAAPFATLCWLPPAASDRPVTRPFRVRPRPETSHLRRASLRPGPCANRRSTRPGRPERLGPPISVWTQPGCSKHDDDPARLEIDGQRLADHIHGCLGRAIGIKLAHRIAGDRPEVRWTEIPTMAPLLILGSNARGQGEGRHEHWSRKDLGPDIQIGLIRRSAGCRPRRSRKSPALLISRSIRRFPDSRLRRRRSTAASSTVSAIGSTPSIASQLLRPRRDRGNPPAPAQPAAAYWRANSRPSPRFAPDMKIVGMISPVRPNYLWHLKEGPPRRSRSSAAGSGTGISWNRTTSGAPGMSMTTAPHVSISCSDRGTPRSPDPPIRLSTTGRTRPWACFNRTPRRRGWSLRSPICRRPTPNGLKDSPDAQFRRRRSPRIPAISAQAT